MQNKSGGGGSVGYRIEVIVKMQKKESRGRVDVIPVEQGVDQVGECVPRIKVIVKMPKKKSLGSSGWMRQKFGGRWM